MSRVKEHSFYMYCMTFKTHFLCKMCWFLPSKILFIVKSEAVGFLVCQDHSTVSICACSS